MEYRRLGRSGLQISPIVLGTMNFGKPTEKDTPQLSLRLPGYFTNLASLVQY